MTTKQFLLIIIIILFGFIYFLADAKAKSGQIIVYDDQGNVEHVEKFGYTPVKGYTPPKVVKKKLIVKDTKAPAAPTGAHIVKEEPYVNFQEGWKKKRYKDMSKKERAVWRKMTKYQGRSRKIDKIEYEEGNGRAVTTTYRTEKDKKGRVFKTKEVQVDNRTPNLTPRQRKKASDNAPQPFRFKKEKRIK